MSCPSPRTLNQHLLQKHQGGQCSDDFTTCTGVVASQKGTNHPLKINCPPLSRKRGDIKSHSSVCLSVCPSVTKTLTLAITFALLQVELWYLTCVFFVTRPLRWYHVVTLTMTFDLLQGQICCRAGDHNSLNLLDYLHTQCIFKYEWILIAKARIYTCQCSLYMMDCFYMQNQTRPHYPQSTAHGFIERILAIFAFFVQAQRAKGEWYLTKH